MGGDATHLLGMHKGAGLLRVGAGEEKYIFDTGGDGHNAQGKLGGYLSGGADN